MQVRPTSDRLRETLFNVIAPRIEGARFLDLCAGSGAVGIEALSRDATHITFVDQSRKMCGLVESNLDLCRVPEDETEVVQAEASDFLRRGLKSAVLNRAPSEVSLRSGRGHAPAQGWDIVFFDPPYSSDYSTVIELIGSNAANLLTTEGLVVVEHHHKKELPEESGDLIRKRILKQGDSALSFYEIDN